MEAKKVLSGRQKRSREKSRIFPFSGANPGEICGPLVPQKEKEKSWILVEFGHHTAPHFHILGLVEESNRVRCGEG